MDIQFYKYQGTGNDFIVIDNRLKTVDLKEEQIQGLCDRKFGIGADGLMLLNPSSEFDFEMKYYNSDGREGSMCGNGGRCLVKFAYDLGIRKPEYTFNAVDGVHEAEIDPDGTVSLKMKDVDNVEVVHGDFVMNTGSPHYVKLVRDVMSTDVVKRGQEIRNSEDFEKDGINVNFVQQEDDDLLYVRTYERGVEDETLSCGTGVTAAAIALYHNENGYNNVRVKTRGGILSVEYDKIDDRYENVWLTGPADQVFTGTVKL
ncbi:MAG TPA: diaminopimelate epimerase [Flavitalea sp.]|nr:diaminopimelate epimerase [Flavitalea sp.]